MVFQVAGKKTLKRDKVVSLYFHPWEFTEIKQYGLPKYISKHSGDKMLQRLEETILYLKPIAEFVTMNEYVTDFKNNK